MRSKCGVYCFSLLSDKSTLCTLAAHARSAVVIADAVIQPSAEIPNTGLVRRRSKRALLRHATPTGHSLASIAIANNFVSPLFLFLCVR